MNWFSFLERTRTRPLGSARIFDHVLGAYLKNMKYWLTPLPIGERLGDNRLADRNTGVLYAAVDTGIIDGHDAMEMASP